MLSNSPGGEVGGHDQEPGEDNQLEQEGEEREEQTGDGLTNGFWALDNDINMLGTFLFNL